MSRAKAIALALPLLSAPLIGGCASTAPADEQAVTEAEVEQAMAEKLEPATADEIAAAERADPLTRANFWGKEFRKDPTKLDVTIQFLEALRAIGSHERAIEVATKTVPLHPKSAELQIIMGRALLSQNRVPEAAEIYSRAATVDPKNPAAFAGLGLALDRLERHADAQNAYEAALDLDPQRISTLSNYGLSLALSGDLDGAEARLREAAGLPGANAQVRQNLALVLGLQGKFEAAREIDPHAPKRTVEGNIETLKTVLAPVRNYDALREDGADSKAPEPSVAPQQQPEQTPAPDPEETPPMPAQEEASTPLQLRGSLGGN